ncbi:MAG: hypothetical protein KDC57_16310 [Saprospiraceae bacterium]|nr:hypothetical protein [Saprospiraceae bacterium]
MTTFGLDKWLLAIGAGVLLIGSWSSCSSFHIQESNLYGEYQSEVEKVNHRMIGQLDECIDSSGSSSCELSSYLPYQQFYIHHQGEWTFWLGDKIPVFDLDRMLQMPIREGIIALGSKHFLFHKKKRDEETTAISLAALEDIATYQFQVEDMLQVNWPPEKDWIELDLQHLPVAINIERQLQNQNTMLVFLAVTLWIILFLGLYILLSRHSSWSDWKSYLSWGIGNLILILAIPFGILPLFTDQVIQTHLATYTLLGLLLLGIVFYFHRQSGQIFNFLRKRKVGDFPFTAVTYIVIISGFLGLARIAQSFVLDLHIPLELDNFFASQINSLVALIALIILSIALFVLHHRLLTEIIERDVDHKVRLISYLIASFFSLGMYWLLSIAFSWTFFFLFAAIYIILFELFLETVRPSITWLITWLILFSGFTAIILFKFNWLEDLNQRTKLGYEVLTNPPVNVEDYSVARYINGELEKSNASDIYPSKLPFKLPSEEGVKEIIQDGRSELLVWMDTHTVAIIGKPLMGMIKPISAFSYVFILFLLCFILLVLSNTYGRFIPTSLQIDLSNSQSLRNRIQLSVIAVIMASFLIIAVITVFYFKNSAEATQYSQLRSKLSAAIQSIEATLTTPINDETNLNRIVVQLKDFASINKTNLELFDVKGHRIHSFSGNSSNAQIYNEWIPYNIFHQFAASRNQNYLDIQSDYGTTFFAPIHIGLILAGFISIPDLDSSRLLQQNVNDFIGTLLNVYIFLLLLAGSVAIAVANSITRPLFALGENLKQIKLGQPNKKLHWDNMDEVGELINNYNEMIQKLEDSAQFLAHTEREMAWREMAKQVAHEIKNPLTPMKLSIQHMQMAIRSRPEEIQQVVDRVSHTLVEQIDNLSQIASEFSNFAKMPQPENEKVILNEIVANVHDLFRKREDMDISLYVPMDEIYVFADKNHLLRVLNNLVKNATQSIPKSRRGKIMIRLYKEGDHARIEVEDNGIGIPENMKDKVFYPNFTTKSSGTGLGLAISYNIIESFNGKIYFRTELNKGSTFIIDLPLMHMKDNFMITERVTL